MDIERKSNESVVTMDKVKVHNPKMYNVILLNDDYTTQDFVVAILISIFGKTFTEAQELMLEVHTKGSGIAGVYSYDIAVSKSAQVTFVAEENGFPLKCKVEKV